MYSPRGDAKEDASFTPPVAELLVRVARWRSVLVTAVVVECASETVATRAGQQRGWDT